MKKINTLLLLLAAGIFSSCDTNAVFSDYVPVYPVSSPVKSATAVSMGFKTGTDLDNTNHKITFKYMPGFCDVTKMDITLEYDNRATPKAGSFTHEVKDLTTPYQFVLNDRANDVTYTMSVKEYEPQLLVRDECSVFRVQGDAQIKTEGQAYAKRDTSYLFDGKYMSKANAKNEIGMNRFAWQMSEEHEGHGNWFVMKVNRPVTLYQIRIWPYEAYCKDFAAVYDVYAWVGEGAPDSFEPSGQKWVKIISADHTDLYEIEKKAIEEGKTGTDEDICTNPPFDKSGQCVESQYFCLDIVKNYYLACEETPEYAWRFACAEIELYMCK